MVIAWSKLPCLSRPCFSTFIFCCISRLHLPATLAQFCCFIRQGSDGIFACAAFHFERRRLFTAVACFNVKKWKANLSALDRNLNVESPNYRETSWRNISALSPTHVFTIQYKNLLVEFPSYESKEICEKISLNCPFLEAMKLRTRFPYLGKQMFIAPAPWMGGNGTLFTINLQNKTKESPYTSSGNIPFQTQTLHLT
jgi:hypothetical protein